MVVERRLQVLVGLGVGVFLVFLVFLAVPAVAEGDGPLPMSERGGTFADDDGNIHEAYIEALAVEGIIRGCDPPRNDRYCPHQTATRAQLAAVLRRALNLQGATRDQFVDDDTSVFEGDINAIAAVGITRGCNPPVSDRYCPDRGVTRGEMAVMVRRAFHVPSSGVDAFVDDDTSIFEDDINAIAAVGITRGCNPPVNDRYCPDRALTRGELASLVARAAGLSPVTPPPGVTTRPDAPTALNGRLVPWDEVGPGWYLVLYQARRGLGADQQGEAAILYVVDPGGVRYEVAAWHDAGLPEGIFDWRPDGKAALLFFYDYELEAGPRRVLHVDFTSGFEHIVSDMEPSAFVDRMEFSRPTGVNFVVRVVEQDTERVERRTVDGALLAVLSERAAPTGFEPLAETSWLYGTSGLDVVLGGPGGMRLVSNDGTLRTALSTPSGRVCRPIRWWTADSVLAQCHIADPALQPHPHYFQLWLLPIDGSAGTALTALPTEPVPPTDYGFEDAINTPSGVRLTRSPACDRYTVGALSSLGEWEPLVQPQAGKGLIGVHDGRMAMMTWPYCDISAADFITTDLDGRDRKVLVPHVGIGVIGVWDVAALE
jgi:TolB protein